MSVASKSVSFSCFMSLFADMKMASSARADIPGAEEVRIILAGSLPLPIIISEPITDHCNIGSIADIFVFRSEKVIVPLIGVLH